MNGTVPVPRSEAGRWIWLTAAAAFADAICQVCTIRLIAYSFPVAMMFAISLVASLAIFTTGLGALLSRRLAGRTAALSLAAGGAMLAGCFALGVGHRIGQGPEGAWTIAAIVAAAGLVLLLTVLPFLLLGALIGMFYLRAMEVDPSSVRRIAAASAVAFFAGYLAGALLVRWTGLWTLTITSAALLGLLWLPPRRLALALAVVAALLAATGAEDRIHALTRKQPFIWSRLQASNHPVLGFWSPYARLDFVDIGGGQLAGLYNGIQFWATGPVRYDDPGRRLGYPLLKGDVLVIGSGGGHGLLSLTGASSVTAVELDPGVVSALRGPLARWCGDIYNRVAEVAVGDGRAFLETTDRTFDVIILEGAEIAVPSSMRSVFNMENFLYTREGLAVAMARLRPDGLMIVGHTRGMVPVGRLLAGLPSGLHYRVLESNPQLVLPSGPTGKVVQDKKKRAITFSAIATIISRTPDRLVDVSDGWRAPPEVKIRDITNDPEMKAEIANAAPITDNRPVLIDLPPLAALLFFVPALILSLAAIPIVRRLPRRRTGLYFGLIGAGYLTVELYLVNGLRSLLGGYVETSAFVLGAFVVAAAAGALAGSRLSRSVLALLLGPGLLLAWCLVRFPPWGLPFAVRAAVVAGGIAPAGFAIGALFPRGLELAEPGRAGVYYAVDTMGAAVGFLLFYAAMLFSGYDAVLLMAGAIYLAALLLADGSVDTSAVSTVA